MVVLPSARMLVQRQKTGRVPLFNRRLGNQLLGQVIVKIAGLHLYLSMGPRACALEKIPQRKNFSI
ncbi:hypothetical protein SDC9_131659 [bioreactor metagenome]|uniref:Uncharacterized protein n=1 Tax=bioreactor metagenome TaxID=1076179 RepID=A0A645D5D1_9ZZZZ